jgi:hypothetical protein
MDFQRHYAKLISRARHRPVNRGNHDHEAHHVLPRCMGGNDDPKNIVSLTAEEHFIAHLLLAKMYPDNERVTSALALMGRRGSDFTGPKNKRYGLGVRRHRRRWANTGGQYIFPRKPGKPKRFSANDVERLRLMLAAGTK